MSNFEVDLRRCRVVLMLRAVLEARGNISRAALAIGVHRNTIWRELSGAGYTAAKLRRMARRQRDAAQKKPPVSVEIDGQ